MKTYKIPIIYQSVRTFTIKGNNLQEAVEFALKAFLATPDDGYIEDSFEIDSIVEDRYKEVYDICKVIDKL